MPQSCSKTAGYSSEANNHCDELAAGMFSSQIFRPMFSKLMNKGTHIWHFYRPSIYLAFVTVGQHDRRLVGENVLVKVIFGLHSNWKMVTSGQYVIVLHHWPWQVNTTLTTPAFLDGLDQRGMHTLPAFPCVLLQICIKWIFESLHNLC